MQPQFSHVSSGSWGRPAGQRASPSWLNHSEAIRGRSCRDTVIGLEVIKSSGTRAKLFPRPRRLAAATARVLCRERGINAETPVSWKYGGPSRKPARPRKNPPSSDELFKGRSHIPAGCRSGLPADEYEGRSCRRRPARRRTAKARNGLATPSAMNLRRGRWRAAKRSWLGLCGTARWGEGRQRGSRESVSWSRRSSIPERPRTC